MDSVTLNIPPLFVPPCHWVLVASLKAVDISSKKNLLSTDELLRCDRFRRQEDQQRYILAHTLKRYCLSRYLQVPAASLAFSSGAKGKPYCTHKNAPAFNLSHSGDFVLLGLSAVGHIGVDVEVVNRDVSKGIFSKVLSPEQQKKVLSSVDPNYEFICYWTQKEAISKALGLGLSIDFTTVECSGVEGEFDTHHSKQHLLVATRQWDDEHIISVAATVSEPLSIYNLSSWEDNLLVESQENTPAERQYP